MGGGALWLEGGAYIWPLDQGTSEVIYRLGFDLLERIMNTLPHPLFLMAILDTFTWCQLVSLSEKEMGQEGSFISVK